MGRPGVELLYGEARGRIIVWGLTNAARHSVISCTLLNFNFTTSSLSSRFIRGIWVDPAFFSSTTVKEMTRERSRGSGGGLECLWSVAPGFPVLLW